MCVFQADVPDHPCVIFGCGARVQVHRIDGHRPGGQQALQIRLPQILVAGGRQG